MLKIFTLTLLETMQGGLIADLDSPFGLYKLQIRKVTEGQD